MKILWNLENLNFLGYLDVSAVDARMQAHKPKLHWVWTPHMLNHLMFEPKVLPGPQNGEGFVLRN